MSAEAAPPPSVCRVHVGPVAGLEPPVLDQALRLEQRKAGIVPAWSEAVDAASCPPAEGLRIVVVVGGPDPVVLHLPAGERLSLPLDGVDPIDRAQDLARRVVAVLAYPDTIVRPWIVERDLPARRPPPAPSAPASEGEGARVGVGGYIQAGGHYGYEIGPGVHAVGVEVEGGLTWFDERLAAGLRAGWNPVTEIPGAAIPARVQSVPAGVMIRGGLRAGRVRVRLGLGAGLEWRRITFTPSTLLAPMTHASWAPTLDGEIEVVVPLWEGLRLSMAGVARACPAWTGYAWYGTTAVEGTRAAIGAAVRLGAALPWGAR